MPKSRLNVKPDDVETDPGGPGRRGDGRDGRKSEIARSSRSQGKPARHKRLHCEPVQRRIFQRNFVITPGSYRLRRSKSHDRRGGLGGAYGAWRIGGRAAWRRNLSKHMLSLTANRRMRDADTAALAGDAAAGARMIDRMIDRRRLRQFRSAFSRPDHRYLGIGVLSIYSVTHDTGGTGLPFLCEAGGLDSTGSRGIPDHAHIGLSSIARLAYPAYAIILMLLAVVLFEGQNQSRRSTMDSDRTLCLSAVGIRQTGVDSGAGALLFEGPAGRLAAARRDSRGP